MAVIKIWQYTYNLNGQINKYSLFHKFEMSNN